MVNRQGLRFVNTKNMGFLLACLTSHVVFRFSSDVTKVDDTLPFYMNILIAHSANLAGLLCILVATSPPLLLLVVPVAMVYR